MKLLDTDFLIDLQREWVAGTAGSAHLFLERQRGEPLVISVITALEFLEGYEDVEEGKAFLSPYRKLPVTVRVADLGSRIRRELRAKGTPIGDFDVLIAATALSAGATLVTANESHHSRIEPLQVAGYP